MMHLPLEINIYFDQRVATLSLQNRKQFFIAHTVLFIFQNIHIMHFDTQYLIVSHN